MAHAQTNPAQHTQLAVFNSTLLTIKFIFNITKAKSLQNTIVRLNLSAPQTFYYDY